MQPIDLIHHVPALTAAVLNAVFPTGPIQNFTFLFIMVCYVDVDVVPPDMLCPSVIVLTMVMYGSLEMKCRSRWCECKMEFAHSSICDIPIAQSIGYSRGLRLWPLGGGEM